MENQQEQTQPAAVPFSQVFLEWCRVTTLVLLLGDIALLLWAQSPSAILGLLIASGVVAMATVLCGTWILTNTRPRELLARRRFAKILGFFLPFVFVLLGLLLSGLGIGLGIFLLVIGIWNPFAIILIAGTVLGGDRAARRMEGRPLPNVIASMFRRS